MRWSNIFMLKGEIEETNCGFEPEIQSCHLKAEVMFDGGSVAPAS